MSIMSARRADEMNNRKLAVEAHRLWEAEKNELVLAAHEHELQRWQTVAHGRQRLYQQQVCNFIFHHYHYVVETF